MNFSFSNLLGGPYRGGNLLLHDKHLLSPVGNRVQQVDLACSTTTTFPFQNLKQIRVLALSPNGDLLLSVDVDGRALLSHRRRRVVLHHFSFKEKVRVAHFSPDGKYIAVGVGKLLQVWHTPGLARNMTPMRLHRTYGHAHNAITCVAWGPDSQWLVAAGKDLVARVYSLNSIEGYRPCTLAGHRDTVMGVFFLGAKAAADAVFTGDSVPQLMTVTKDKAVFLWRFAKDVPEGVGPVDHDDDAGGEQDGAEVAPSKAGKADGVEAKPIDAPEALPARKRRKRADQQAERSTEAQQQSDAFANGRWHLIQKVLLFEKGASGAGTVTAVDYHEATAKLLVAYQNGTFELFQLPEVQIMQTLSISRNKITAATFNQDGEWLALGSSSAGQLLVWEWRSETYIVKQQGHYYDVAALAYSPEGGYLVTGADDAKVKVWNLLSGFCFVTFSEHKAPVTGVQFVGSGHAVLSSSLDGTVRAFDLVRYRNFRTFTASSPVQFISLAVDAAGEIVTAGTLDDFAIYVWSLKTGRLLDVLSGHGGPVSGLAFNPVVPMLLSCSWDKTLRTWDVFGGKGGMETLAHSHDVLALSAAPSGKMVATATLDGQIYFWNPLEGEVLGTIEGRRDITGGQPAWEKRARTNQAAGQCFTSLQFSADGSYLVAGGASKWVCLYDAVEHVMLRRFQLSINKSLEGVLDDIDHRDLTDAGHVDMIDDEADSDDELLPPSAAGGVAGKSGMPGTTLPKAKPTLRTRAVALAPTGGSFAAATTEGVAVYAPQGGLLFDPTDLGEEVTPQAIKTAIAAGAHLRACLLALRLNEPSVLQLAVLSTPLDQVAAVTRAIPTVFLSQMLSWIGSELEASAHVEALLLWVKEVMMQHGGALQARGVPRGAPSTAAALGPALRAVHKAATRIHQELGSLAQSNMYTLQYLATAAQEEQLAPAIDIP